MNYNIRRNWLGKQVVRFDCPNCGEIQSVSLELCGSRRHCQDCEYEYVVPGGDQLRQDAEEKRKRASQKRQSQPKPHETASSNGTALGGSPKAYVNATKKKDGQETNAAQLVPIPSVAREGAGIKIESKRQASRQLPAEITHSVRPAKETQKSRSNLRHTPLIISSGLIDYPFDVIGPVHAVVVADDTSVGCDRALSMLMELAREKNANALLFVDYRSRLTQNDPHSQRVEILATATAAVAKASRRQVNIAKKY